jgi:predicted phosphodiesterase
MIIGTLSDTHLDKANAIYRIMEEFKKRKVEVIVHCGDIEKHHLNPSLFLNLPVICAINPEQEKKQEFVTPPDNWIFTTTKNRVKDFRHARMYVGHRRSFDFLRGSETEMAHILQEARKDFDGLRWYFSGHTHHQIYIEIPTVKFINPGAVEDSFDGYEYSIINTENSEIVFSRIMRTNPLVPTFSIGIISDSLDVSRQDPSFWQLLAKELHARDAKIIIHCGNINLCDIGKKELKDFVVHYNLRADQQNPTNVPQNWRLISTENPVVEINGYFFYVQLDLGLDLLSKSEISMSMLSLEKRRKFPEISYILCGFTHNALYVEGNEIRILNPGDANKDRNFAVLCLPRNEITFGHVPIPPLSTT